MLTFVSERIDTFTVCLAFTAVILSLLTTYYIKTVSRETKSSYYDFVEATVRLKKLKDAKRLVVINIYALSTTLILLVISVAIKILN